MNVKSIVDRVSKYDTNLAKEISGYLNSRKYGLVYEESKPEFVSLPNKEVVRGDLVNILPPRKTLTDENKDKNKSKKSQKKDKDKSKNDEDDNKKYEHRWRVISLDRKNNKATLLSLEKDQATVTANYDDLVAISRFDQPIYTGLKEVDRIERGGDKPFNTVINGENFHALETLMYAYYGKIDCIYIDPPYNSGATDWKYNNNYVGEEDSYRHSKWLTFMADRLKLAKKLLNPRTGVLIVTIDEHEVHHLRSLLEETLPNAYIQMVTMVINPKGSTRGRFSRVEEYAIYCFMPDAYVHGGTDSMLGMDVKNKSTPRWKGLLRSGMDARREDSKNLFYPILIDEKKNRVVRAGEPLEWGKTPDYSAKIDGYSVAWPIRSDFSEGRWMLGHDTFNNLLDKGYIALGNYDKKRDTWGITYLSQKFQRQIDQGTLKIVGKEENDQTVKVEYTEAQNKQVKTVWNRSRHDAGAYGSDLLQTVTGRKNTFTFPKSLYATKDAISMVVRDNPNAIILDFFAGSGTTEHAVNLINAEDGGNRQCICVTNNEVSSKESAAMSKKGLRAGDKDWEKFGIAHYVTWPRVKCAISGKTVNGDPIKGGYDLQEQIYEPIKEKIVNPKTGKKVRKTLYEKKKQSVYPKLKGRKKSEGFKENAVFFDLKYLEPSIIKADLAFDEIAPLLWMKAGSKGRIIKHKSDYDITDEYAVLFNYKYVGKLTRLLKQRPEVRTIFIITDVNSRYQEFCHEFNDRNVYKLYESYLKSFKIQSLN